LRKSQAPGMIKPLQTDRGSGTKPSLRVWIILNAFYLNRTPVGDVDVYPATGMTLAAYGTDYCEFAFTHRRLPHSTDKYCIRNELVPNRCLNYSISIRVFIQNQ
jgi:hypothetical protein